MARTTEFKILKKHEGRQTGRTDFDDEEEEDSVFFLFLRIGAVSGAQNSSGYRGKGEQVRTECS